MGNILFDGKGPLASALRKRGRNPSNRPIQQQYADHLERCLQNRSVAFVDAETGVGKTLAYLIPMIEAAHADRQSEHVPIVVVSTATVALQKQLMEHDVSIAIEAFEAAYGHRHLTTAMRVGKGQIADVGLLEQAAETYATRDEAELVEDVVSWCQERLDNGQLPLRTDLAAFFAERLSTVPIWLSRDLISLRPETVDADARTVELFAEQIERCDKADVLIVNHALMALQSIRPFLWESDRPAFVVFDEADRLPSAVELVDRSHVPLQRLSSMAAQAETPLASSVLGEIDKLSTLLVAQHDVAWTGRGGGVASFARLDHVARTAIIESTIEVSGQITAITRDARLSARLTGVQNEMISTLERYAVGLDRVVRTAQENDLNRALVVYSPVRSYPGLANLSAGAAKRIAKSFWGSQQIDVRGLLFTSATLSTLAQGSQTEPRRALTAFISQCGFKNADIATESCAVLAPGRFGEMTFVRPALNAPTAFQGADDADEGFSVSEDAIEHWSKLVQSAAEAGGRVLVLLPSFRDVGVLCDALEPVLGDRLVAQRANIQTPAAISLFLRRQDAIWVSASAWEGVSLPGAIRHVVIPRLPIRPVSFEDTLLERYIRTVTGSETQGKSVIFGNIMADARRRLRQGIGRGIRSYDDQVTVWLADPRWPVTQGEIDDQFLDQPRTWSTTMVNAIPQRFRKTLDTSARFL